MGIEKGYMFYCENKWCNNRFANGDQYCEFMSAKSKKDAIYFMSNAGWRNNGDNWYCCPECQKEAEGNADKK
jgi:hypothetical protein